VFGTVLQNLLRLEKFVLLAGRLFHIFITRLLKGTHDWARTPSFT